MATPRPRARLAYLDVARGLSIVLVALYHSGLQPLLPQTMQVIGLFRLPLFFFLSGLLFQADRAPGSVALDKARTLLRPYVAVLLLLLARSMLKGEGDPVVTLAGIAWGNGGTIEWIPMWFLPHLWLVCVAAALWLRLSGWAGWSPVWQGVAWVALLMVGAWWPVPDRAFSFTLPGHVLTLPWLPLSADLLGISLAFLLLGVRLQGRSRSFVPHAGALALAIAIVAAVGMGSEAAVNLNLRLYRAPWLATPAALAGIYAVLCISHWLAGKGSTRRVLAHLGRASLFILVFHDHVDNKVQAWLGPRMGPGHEWVVAMLAFAACLAVPLLIREAVLRSRALAWLFGQRLP